MGKMKVVFTGDTAVSELDDHNTSEPFKIAEQEAGHIVILTNPAKNLSGTGSNLLLTGVGR